MLRTTSILTTLQASPRTSFIKTKQFASMSSFSSIESSTIRMPSGYDIPRVGFGVYQTPKEEAEDVTRHAVRSGYRHVDSAVAYYNEQATWKGMQSAGVPREQLFFTSKVAPKHVNYDGAKADVQSTLKETGLDYIDLYLLHSPYGGKEARLGAWNALVEAVEAGKVRSIGVSNYGVHHLEELEKHIAEVDSNKGKGKGGVLSVNQVELHPWLARDDIVSWCQSRGIVMEAYSPLTRAKKFDDERVQKLVKKHNKTPAQILLRWGLQKDFVILPKSVTHSRIEDNSKIFDFELSKEDMELLNTGEYTVVAWDPTVSKD